MTVKSPQVLITLLHFFSISLPLNESLGPPINITSLLILLHIDTILFIGKILVLCWPPMTKAINFFG